MTVSLRPAGVLRPQRGVGPSLFPLGSNDRTGDIVITDGKPSAKVGRGYRPSSRLELVT
jgi:hypothetical protein